jgi:Tfp pilus assembly protein PilE
MAGLEFDRQAFVPANTVQGKSVVQLLIPLVEVAALALIAFVGYKAFLVNTQNNEAAAANAQVQQLEQQIAEMQKRIDTLGKHRKVESPAEASPVPLPAVTGVPSTTKTQRTVYRIAAASAQPAQPKTTLPSPNVPAPPNVTSPEIVGEVNANRDAWQATTNRLADVVGVVGAQQGEISATRDAVNQLLAQTRRQAVSFEVDRHDEPIPVGPVTLQFKSADAKGQHYTLCVYFNSQKCIELRDRSLNEVVVFVVAKNQSPLELVATKIDHDQVVGYLEIPTTPQ